MKFRIKDDEKYCFCLQIVNKFLQIFINKSFYSNPLQTGDLSISMTSLVAICFILLKNSLCFHQKKKIDPRTIFPASDPLLSLIVVHLVIHNRHQHFRGSFVFQPYFCTSLFIVIQLFIFHIIPNKTILPSRSHLYCQKVRTKSQRMIDRRERNTGRFEQVQRRFLAYCAPNDRSNIKFTNFLQISLKSQKLLKPSVAIRSIAFLHSHLFDQLNNDGFLTLPAAILDPPYWWGETAVISGSRQKCLEILGTRKKQQSVAVVVIDCCLTDCFKV